MTFKIRKNSHYSNGFFYKLFKLINTKKELKYSVIFDDSCIYVDDTIDRLDVNKLFGFSNGSHHNNSYRFGWNCIDDSIKIYAYTYVDGKRIIKTLGTVEINKTYKFIITINHDILTYKVISENNRKQEVIMLIPNRKLFGYTLWPYFGGNKTAPKNIFIKLK